MYNGQTYEGFTSGLLTEPLRQGKIRKLAKNVLLIHPSVAESITRELSRLGILWYAGSRRAFRPKKRLLILVSRFFEIDCFCHHCLEVDYAELRARYPHERLKITPALYFTRTYRLYLFRSDRNKYAYVGLLMTDSCIRCHEMSSDYSSDCSDFQADPSLLRPLTQHDRARWNLPEIKNPILLLRILSEPPSPRLRLEDIAAQYDEDFEVKFFETLKAILKAVTDGEEIPETVNRAIVMLLQSGKDDIGYVYPRRFRAELLVLQQKVHAYAKPGTLELNGEMGLLKKEIVTRCSNICQEFARFLKEHSIPVALLENDL